MDTLSFHCIALLPWQEPDSVAPSWWLVVLLVIFLAAAAVWMVISIPAPKSWMLVAIAIALCFTGSAAMALHSVALDPFMPSAALAFGALGGWFRMREKPELKQSEISELSAEERPVFVLTLGLKNEAAVREELGPFAFLSLTAAFRRRASSFLLARHAILLPGGGETLQACFGVPAATSEDAENAAETSLLLANAMNEYLHQQEQQSGKQRLTFGIALKHGLATTGTVEGGYQVAGPVVKESEILWQSATAGMVVTDGPTADMLPDSLHGEEIQNGVWRLLDEDMQKPVSLLEEPTSAPPARHEEPSFQAVELAKTELPSVQPSIQTQVAEITAEPAPATATFPNPATKKSAARPKQDDLASAETETKIEAQPKPKPTAKTASTGSPAAKKKAKRRK